MDDGSLKLPNLYETTQGNNFFVQSQHVLQIAVDANGSVYVGSTPSDMDAIYGGNPYNPINGTPVSRVMLLTWNNTQWVTVGNGLCIVDAGGSNGSEEAFGPVTALRGGTRHEYLCSRPILLWNQTEWYNLFSVFYKVGWFSMD